MFCSEGSKIYSHTFIYVGVDLEMQSVLDITETEVRKTRGKTYLPPPPAAATMCDANEVGRLLQ